jgi:hypothetical protein
MDPNPYGYTNPAIANPLEKILNTIEDGLSYAAVIPGVGLTKVALGTLQVVIAVATLILIAIPLRLFGKSSYLLTKSILHIKHGCGNILAGTLEALPVIGIIMLLERRKREAASRDPMRFCIVDPEAFKYMAYESVQKANFYPCAKFRAVITNDQLQYYYQHLTSQLVDNSADGYKSQQYKQLCRHALFQATGELV